MRAVILDIDSGNRGSRRVVVLSGVAILLLCWVCAFIRAANHGKATVGAMQYQLGRLLFQLIPPIFLAVTLLWVAVRLARRLPNEGAETHPATCVIGLIGAAIWVVVPLYVALVFARGTVFDTERGRSSLGSSQREITRIWRQMSR